MTTVDSLNCLFEQLAEVRRHRPGLRFGQMIAIIGELAADETGHSLWDVEDVEFAAALERFAADVRRATSGAAEPSALP